MKLAKALKHKNKLTRKIKDLNTKICEYNVSNERRPSPYSVRDLIKQRDALVEELILLKVNIQRTNMGIVDKIIRLGEVKNTLSQYERLNTYTEHESVIDMGYGENTKEIKAYSVINTNEKDGIVEAIQNDIENLQDQIDHFNATTDLLE